MFQTWKEFEDDVKKKDKNACLIKKCIALLKTHQSLPAMSSKEIYDHLVNITETMIKEEMTFPTWKELRYYVKKGDILFCIIWHCIVEISTHPNFSSMTPEEIYDDIVDQTKSIHGL